MATTRVILRKERTDSRGVAPLYLRITYQRRSSYVSLKLNVPIKKWDEINSRVKPSFPNAQEINSWILQKQSELEKAWLKAKREKVSIQVHELKEQIYGKIEIDFFEVAKDDYSSFREKGKINTWRRSVSIINKFQEYLKVESIAFSKITLETIKAYETYCRVEKGNKTNSIQRDMKYIRKMFIMAEKRGWIQKSENPFNFYKIDYDPTPVAFLKIDQIKKFEELENIKPGNEQLYHDIFMFTIYGIGQRVSDSFLLKRKNYDGKSIELISKKTGDQIYINLTQKARTILEKYITPEHKPDDFIFPVLSGYTGLADKEILNKAIASKTTVYNKTLRRFGKSLELGVNLTTHVARHTWATRAGQLGVRLEIIQAILGHSNIQQTMRYRHIINEELNAAISIIE